MEITLEVREDNIQFFMELIKKLDFVKVKHSNHDAGTSSPYDPEYVTKIRRSEKQVAEGNFKQMNPAYFFTN